jgi:hypothetical protein
MYTGTTKEMDLALDERDYKWDSMVAYTRGTHGRKATTFVNIIALIREAVACVREVML